MERMLCLQCAAVTYSAAATKMVERGERCQRCGGQLSVEPSEPVGVAPDRAGPQRRTA
jgi:hypothetical protein